MEKQLAVVWCQGEAAAEVDIDKCATKRELLPFLAREVKQNDAALVEECDPLAVVGDRGVRAFEVGGKGNGANRVSGCAVEVHGAAGDDRERPVGRDGRLTGVFQPFPVGAAVDCFQNRTGAVDEEDLVVSDDPTISRIWLEVPVLSDVIECEGLDTLSGSVGEEMERTGRPGCSQDRRGRDRHARRQRLWS